MAEANELFPAAPEEGPDARLPGTGPPAPLADRLRPRSLDEVVGQDHLLAPGAPLRTLLEADRVSSLVLWGPPGTGKTTLARLVAQTTSMAFVPMSAVNVGVKDVRGVIDAARRRRAQLGQGTILFLDEVHRFNKAQQDALLPAVETGELTFVGATTENPFFEVNAPLLSRSLLFRLEALSPDHVRAVVARALRHEGAEAEPDAIDFLAQITDGDARAALTSLEVAMALAASRGPEGAVPRVTVADVEAARHTRALRYEEDDHYDVVSAFIKSIRGSDPDAGLYWLARMLAAGEDARFIARRLVILASEDIGLADSTGLLVADAAARAVEFVGLPEAQLNLAHAVVYLATAAKSNRTTLALGRAQADVRQRRSGPVPAHLRDSHYAGAEHLGHGVGYEYPHDHPSGWVPQQYRPDEVAGRTYYEPSAHGEEREIGERMPSASRKTMVTKATGGQGTVRQESGR
ncbi:MAG: replication-associated recombination protein A [Actinomycetota bacterium]|nr:replication-associated recombination protein A [Actinomycetota bacterium]